MKYKRVSKGKELQLLRSTAAHIQGNGRIRMFLENLLWRFGRRSYCPKCRQLTKFDVKAIHHRLPSQHGEETIIAGVIHECIKCNLQIRKGVDSVSDLYIGGIFQHKF